MRQSFKFVKIQIFDRWSYSFECDCNDCAKTSPLKRFHGSKMTS